MHSGSKGQSAIATIAYRSGERLTDYLTGKISDYSRKYGVVYSEIILPDHVMATHPEYRNREILWNEIQKVEKDRGQFSREFEVALPKELQIDQQICVIHDFAEKLVSDGMIVDFSIHAPHRTSEGTNENWHAHISCSTRRIDENGNWCKKRTTMYVLDEDGNKVPEIDQKTGKQKIIVREGHGVEKRWLREAVADTDWNKKEKVNEWRKQWENSVNEGLRRAGYVEQIDCRSLKEQGKERLPQMHVGVTAEKIAQKHGVSSPYRETEDIKRELAQILQMIQKVGEVVQGKLQRAMDAIYERCKKMKEIIEQKGGNRKVQNEVIKEKNLAIDVIERQIENLKKELDVLQRESERNFEREKEIYARLERLRSARAVNDAVGEYAERNRADERRKKDDREKLENDDHEQREEAAKTKNRHRRI